ncbi:hypothetical protein NHX12_014981 [Muraenolepis orangiensis]|uniref:Uncharacterized protein n=1 Tax=Muraenolepis orangiensis TaxID=630683 RepID=A0A9Q0I5M0_9TELE|nr:hypothetical protein NHX12_014981 [Muraenolepis orangiensis]
MLGPSPLPGSSLLPCPSPLPGPSPPSSPTKSFHFSSTGESDDWDTPLQVEHGELLPQVKTPPVRFGLSEAWKLTCLTESQVALDKGGILQGKSWAQIQLEDEEKVESLVQQFRHTPFLCYFDTESLARYGRRSLVKRRHDQNQEAAGLLPLLDHHEDDHEDLRQEAEPVCTRKRRAFRMASRCQ